MRSRIFRCIVIGALLLVMLGLLPSAGLAHAATKRILIIGDSWAHFLYGNRSFRTALVNAGLEDFEEWNNLNNNTAVGGTLAGQWAQDQRGMLTNVKTELQNVPSLDIVWATLGGNDVTADWRPWDSPATQNNRFDAITASMRIVIEQILAVRPNVRFILNGYDYLNGIGLYSGTHQGCYDYVHGRYPTLWPWSFGDPAIPAREEDLTPEQAQALVQTMNEANVALGMKLRDMTLTFPSNRVRYVNNFGVLQIKFGYPGADVPSWLSPYPLLREHEPHWDPNGVDAFRFAAGTTAYPMPGQYPDFTPFTGGDATFMKSPWETQLYPPTFDWIHLTDAGYVAIAENCINAVAREWLLNPLGNPSVLAIEANGKPNDQKQIEFEVLFNKPVTGVDPTDFAVTLTGGMESAEILMVAPISDDSGKSDYARKYSVLVQLATGGGTARLDFVDNDSVSDADGLKVGGTGQGNGAFSSGEAVEVFGAPVSAWPIAVLVILLASLVLQRRYKGLQGLE